MEEQSANLKPIFDGIFGKQKNIVYERPQFAERKIADMLKELSKIPLLDWEKYAFSRDPLVGRISPYKRKEYMQKSWECG
ncbi:MAG: hypothetical protein ACFNJJ_03920, partial [Lachnoanaerobaculum saburreum]